MNLDEFGMLTSATGGSVDSSVMKQIASSAVAVHDSSADAHEQLFSAVNSSIAVISSSLDNLTSNVYEQLQQI